MGFSWIQNPKSSRNLIFQMPLRLDIKRKLLARSDRVKSVDLHPTETWLLVGLYNGNVHIWNYESSQLVKSFEVCTKFWPDTLKIQVGDLPVRTAKFIARKSWVVVGSDDMMLRIFNYNTQERVHQFEAHSDYIRYSFVDFFGADTISILLEGPNASKVVL